MANYYDALVIGGGPGGATTALLLARAGWSVALLERKEFPRRKVCGEYLSASNIPLLEHLGIAPLFEESSGPPVRRVGLFAGQTILDAELPPLGGREPQWGRALGREHLDSLLIRKAAEAGVDVRQPWTAAHIFRQGDVFRCLARAKSGEASNLLARVIIAAHGSWEPGALPTHPTRALAQASDMLGFKAHFQNSDLPPGWMPLLVFPGGYGGMVHSDGGRVSLSCCIRRDVLQCLRKGASETAGELVLDHIQRACLGVRRALAGAVREGSWLSAGPIRPGIRTSPARGIFLVGNCAGEAHSVIAEGISMAMQSGWLLAHHLDAWRKQSGSGADLSRLGYDYALAWRQAFAPRLYTASAVAHWAMRPGMVAATLPLVRFFPALLSWGARLSGKAARIVLG